MLVGCCSGEGLVTARGPWMNPLRNQQSRFEQRGGSLVFLGSGKLNIAKHLFTVVRTVFANCPAESGISSVRGPKDSSIWVDMPVNA